MDHQQKIIKTKKSSQQYFQEKQPNNKTQSSQQSVENKKNEKKKKKNPTTYNCCCGKTYKSYAAVYTHIRIKHESQKRYLNSIQRPNFQRTQKGRPRKYQELVIDYQEQRLQIIENGIVQVVDLLKIFNYSKFILQPKDILQPNQIQQEYKKLRFANLAPLYNILEQQIQKQKQITENQKSSYQEKNLLSYFSSSNCQIPSQSQFQNQKQKQQKTRAPSNQELLQLFYNQFSKHWIPLINAKLLSTINYICIYEKQNLFFEEEQEQELRKNMQKLWVKQYWNNNIQKIGKNISNASGGNQEGYNVYLKIMNIFSEWKKCYCLQINNKKNLV